MATTNLTTLSHSLSLSHSHSHSLYSHSLSHSLSLSSIPFPFPFPFPFPLKQTTQFPATPKPLLKTRSLPRLFAIPKLSDSPSFPLSADTDPATGDLTTEPGVYAVFDGNNEVQFIGLARNVAGSVGVHLNKVPQLCSKVKVGVIDQPDRESLTQAWKSWMEEHIAATGKIPPGNETGNTTWFRPPPQKKRDLRLTPGGNKQLTVPLEELIDKLVKENKVVAFIKGSRSAPQCGFSQRVVGILDSQGVDYESVDVLDDEYNPGLRETLKNYSNWPTFPQVFVKGELVGGCDILTSMNENGELAGLFKE